jgi:hypothetical protein
MGSRRDRASAFPISRTKDNPRPEFGFEVANEGSVARKDSVVS